MTATRSFYCVYDTVGAFYTFLLTTHFFDCVLVIKIVPPEMPGALILAMVVISGYPLGSYTQYYIGPYIGHISLIFCLFYPILAKVELLNYAPISSCDQRDP